MEISEKLDPENKENKEKEDEVNEVQYAELVGKVKSIETGSEPLKFVVHTNKSNKDYIVLCSFFCPLREGDSIYAVCSIEDPIRNGKNKNPILRVLRPPFVQISMDKDSILKCFLQVLRGTGFGNIKAHSLYELLSRQSNGDSNVVQYLSELAAQWLESHDDDLFIPYSSIVSVKQMKKLLIWWHRKRSLRRLYLFGLTNREIRESEMRCDEIYDLLIQNPYRIVNLSVEKCDEILLRQNKIGDADDHRCALITRKIYSYMSERGWCGVPTQCLMNTFPDLEMMWPKLQNEYKCVEDLGTVYLPLPHTVETFITEKIQNLMNSELIDKKLSFEDPYFNCQTLTEEQKTAIYGSLSKNISIIRGSAGTGKTTIISEIIHNLELRNINYKVLSFTGKAVSRIKQVVKRKANVQTIHRCIGFKDKTIQQNSGKKDHSDGNKDFFTQIIIDEASMVTMPLMYRFFCTFPHQYKITLIGDPNQLPPIGWGAFFEQLILSERIPVFTLSQNHRLDKIDGIDNGIMINANRILDFKNGIIPEKSNCGNFELIETPNFNIVDASMELIYDIVKAFISQTVPSSQITIICPYNRDLKELNKKCQQIYNGDNRYVMDNRGICWMINDRVMMTVNDHTNGIMNGEEGTIINLNNEEIEVEFTDGCSHVFKLEKSQKEEEESINHSDFEDEIHESELTVHLLIHSFALTIHKSQGSEWDYVIIYIPPNTINRTFLTSNMIYTSITRAKRAVWVIGDIDAFTQGSSKKLASRHENLAERIRNIPEKNKIIIDKANLYSG